MKAIAAFPLLALALTACAPYYDQQPGYPSYPQDPQGYPQPGYPPYPDQGYPQPYPPGPPMPPGGPVYPGPGQAYPQPGYPSGTTYRAIGTEPFWDLEIGSQMIFTDRGNNVSVAQTTPAPIQGTAGPIYRTDRLEVNIVHRQCNDGMSDRNYPDTVDVRVDGRQRYRGCGAPIEYFNQTDETGRPRDPEAGTYPPPGNYPPQGGYPPPGNYPGTGNYPGPTYPAPGYPGAGAPPGMPVANLTGTNWRVLSINGTRTPASNFYVNFVPDRMGAKFGCNSIGASYSQAGSILSVGPVMATRMACPDMSFENQGSRILERPLTIYGIGERITLSNDRGTIELVRAR